MKKNDFLIDRARYAGTALQSHLIDGYSAGKVSRREFLRHGSVLGLSLTVLGSIAGIGAPTAARARIERRGRRSRRSAPTATTSPPGRWS